MAHKTFISYKYSEAQELRDAIINALGEDAQYYKGETSDSPDMTDESTEKIKKALTDMMYNTSVTIVIISPKMKGSKWIDWEIEYSLKRITRKDRTSQTNGVVGVIMKYDGGYEWFRTSQKGDDGCAYSAYKDGIVYDIILNNRFNQSPKKYTCQKCMTVDHLSGSYISFISEDDFLKGPGTYIDNAYKKSENDAGGYTLKRTR